MNPVQSKLKYYNQVLKKIVKIISISLAAMLMAAACGLTPDRGGKAIELTWWKTFDDPRQVGPLIEEFQKTNKNVKISFVQKNIETYEDELINALASGQGPDIFTIHNDWLPKYKDKMAPVPEKTWPLRDHQESFLETASSDFVDNKQIYAVPLAVDILSMYYNKAIFSSAGIATPPATWEELVSIVPKLTKIDKLGNFQRNAVALGTADNINRAPDLVELLMLQNGTPLYTDDKSRAVFDQVVRQSGSESYSPGTRALEFYTQFANPGKVTYTWNNRSNNSVESFSSGQVAMIFSYGYLKGTLAAKAPFLSYGIAPVPQIEGSGARVNFANYWGEGVSKQSAKQDAAWQFLKFISGKQVLPKYYEAYKQPSSRPDILSQQISDADIGVFAENALSAKSFYKPDANAAESIIIQMINDVVLRDVSVQDAVRSAVAKINLLLKTKR